MIQVQFIDKVAIVLVVQTVQVPQEELVEKDSRSSTGAVFVDRVVVGLVVLQREVRMIQKVVDKVVDILDV